MKSNLWLLVKTNFLNTYKIKSTSKKKWLMTIILIIYIVASLGVSLGMFMTNLYNTLAKANLGEYYLVLVFAIASLFSFVFSIFSAKSGLFENKDNNLLLSLPVTRSDILISRIFMIASYNFLIGLLFIIPGVIIYFKSFAVSFMYVLSIVVLTLFFSIIPTVLACLFGYLVAFLTSKAKHRNIVELLSYTLFIIFYLLLFNNGNKVITYFINDVEFLNIILKTLFLPIYFIYKSLVSSNILYVLMFVLINLLVLFLFVLVFNKNYFKMLSKLGAHKTTSNYKMHDAQVRTVKRALFEKEIKKYFSSAIYVFNTIFGVVFIVIAAIASLIYSPDKLLTMINLSEGMTSFSLVFIFLLFVISLTDTTNSSISIERDNYWIMKMIPVSEKDILKAKLLVNRVVLIPITILSLVLFSISGYITLVEMLLLSILTVFYGFFISNFGLIANLLFPKLDAMNDTVIVKQSAASFLGIMGGVIIFGIIFGITSNLPNILAVIVAIIISMVLYVISKIILDKWGIKRFKEIN